MPTFVRFAAVLVCTSAIQAQTMVAVDWYGRVSKIDLTTHTMSHIGNLGSALGIGFFTANSLVCENGVYYTSGGPFTYPNPRQDTLIRFTINASFTDLTVLSSTPYTSTSGATSFDFRGLAMNSRRELYATGSNGRIYGVNPDTADVTLSKQGSLGTRQSLDMLDDDTLVSYDWNMKYIKTSLGPTLGTWSKVNPVAVNTNRYLQSIDADGQTIYGVGQPLGQSSNDFYAFDFKTGAETLLWSYPKTLLGGDIRGLVLVPEPGSAGLIIIAAFLLCCGKDSKAGPYISE